MDSFKLVDDVTVETGAEMLPGAPFLKVWRVTNNGKTAWEAGYELSFASGSTMRAEVSQPLPALQPDETGEIALALVAPMQPGVHQSNWRARNARGQLFGPGLIVSIRVRPPE